MPRPYQPSARAGRGARRAAPRKHLLRSGAVPLAIVVLVLSGLSVVAARAWTDAQSDVVREPVAEPTASVAAPVAARLTPAPTVAVEATADPFITAAALELTFGDAARTIERDEVARLVAADRRHL